MGLLDILNGMQNGPRGQTASPAHAGGGGMSPLTIALLGLLAYKAIKHMNPGQSSPGPAAPNATPGLDGAGGGLGGLLQGGLGSLLQGPLGGLLAGGAAGGLLTGGLNDLVRQFQQNGLGDIAKSWVDSGPNKDLTPGDLSKTLDDDQIKTLMAHSGLSRDDLIAGLSRQLPELIDRLTPQGRIPTEQEATHLL